MITGPRSFKKHTDAELVKLHLEGNRLAFTAIEARHDPWLISFAFVIVRNHADARDVIQNMWEKAVRRFNKGDYREQNQLKEWLGTLLYHEAIDFVKKRRRHGMSMVAEKRFVDAAPLSSNIYEVTNLRLIRALKTLSEKERMIIDMHFFKRFTFKEIAKVLKRTVGAVTSAYSRALKVLRELMGHSSSLRGVKRSSAL